MERQLTNKELQSISLDIVKDIHRFCVTHKIKYSIAYGTLIGAIRHHGFIPWDDDVDIVMPREDYEKFCSEYCSQAFELIYYGNEKSSICAFARVCECKRTKFIAERPWTNRDCGIWVDIFPLDDINCSVEAYRTKYEFLKRICKFAYLFRYQNHHIVQDDTPKSIIKTYCARIIGLNGFLPYLMIRLMAKLMRNIDKSTPYFGQMSCLDDGPLRFERKDFISTVLVPFENTELCAMNGYDNVLRQIYDDYMQLPPISERKPKQYWIKFIWK